MKVLIFAMMLAVFSCHTPKKDISAEETVNTAQPEATPDTLPPCIRAMIKKFSGEEKTNPPRKIFSYTYKGKKVYYVSAVCCDNFSDLYDNNCKLIAHPDGGFTGRGDGQVKDFAAEKKNEQLVWEDKRKN